MNKKLHTLFIVAVLAVLLINKLVVELMRLYPFWWVLVAIIFFTVITYSLLMFFDNIAVKNIEKSGYFFIGSFLIKLLLILMFLTIFKRFAVFKKDFILNFSLIYLYFLGLSIFLALKILDLRQKK